MRSEKIVDLRARKARFFYRQPRAHDTRVPLRERKRRVRLIALAVLVVFFAVGAYGIHYVSYMERLTLSEVEVQGAETIDAGLIRQYVDHVLRDGSRHYLSRGNIFLYPRSVIEKDLMIDFPRIKSAHISRPSLFSKMLVVAIQERTFFALWCLSGQGVSANECYQMDADGFIFAEAVSGNPAQYTFGGGLSSASSTTFTTSSSSPMKSTIGQVFVPGHVLGLVALLTRLESAGFVPTGAYMENDQDFHVPLKDSFSIKASLGSDAGTLVKNLQLVLANPPLRGNEKKIEYVDLRFGNRVYYKMKGDTSIRQEG